MSAPLLSRCRLLLCVEGAAPLALEAEHVARAGICNQPYLARLAGLEAHRGSGGDVEPHAARRGAIELQRGVGLEEVVVRTHLDRAVAGIGDAEGRARAAGVELDLARLGDDLT